MKKKNQNSEFDPDNPHAVALMMLAPTPDNPAPRYAWDFGTIVTSDLIVRTDMPSMAPLEMADFRWHL